MKFTPAEPTYEQRTQISKALGRLSLTNRFYAEVLGRLPVYFTEDVGTAGTDGIAFYFSPSFMERYDMTLEQAMFVMAHEVEHVVLEHPARRGSADPMDYNIAGDERINNNLFAAGMKGPTDENGKFMGYASSKYADQSWSTELIFRDREQNKPTPPPPPPGGEGDSSDDGGDQGQGQGDDGAGDQSGTTEPGGQPTTMPNGVEDIFAGDVIQPTDENGKPLTGADLAEAHNAVKGAILSAAAATRAIDPGLIPAHLRGPLAELVEPEVDWVEVMRPYMSATAQDDESWDMLDQRMISRRIAMPRLHSVRAGTVGVIVDTSGSCRAHIGPFLSELCALAAEVEPEGIRVIFIDTEVQHDITTTPEDFEADLSELMANPPYGGGTDLRPAFDVLADVDDLECVLCMTDMMTPFPDVDYLHADDTLFLDTYGRIDAPFGEKVLIGR